MDNKKNYLNEVTTKSFLNFSIETVQSLFEMVKLVNNGEDLDYVMANGKHTDNEPPEIVNDLTSKQQDILDALDKENLPYKKIDDDFILEDTDTYRVSKHGLIFTNKDNFISLIKTKYKSNDKLLSVCFREHFIQKEDDCYKLYYYLLIDKNDNKTTNIKMTGVSTEINKAITNKVDECYPDLDMQTKINIISMNERKLTTFNLKLDDVLNAIEEKSKEFYKDKAVGNDKM